MVRKRKLEDEINRSRIPQITKNIIEKHEEYFRDKVESRLSRGQSFSGNQLDEAFYDIIIEDENDDGQVLKWVKEEIQANQAIVFGSAANLQQFLSKLWLQCVERDKSVALKKVLGWFQEEIAPLINHLLIEWEWDKPVRSSVYNPKWTGLTGNSSAMIRACEKDDYGMVSTFMNFKYKLNNDVEAAFRIDDSEFKACEQDEKKRWKNHTKIQNSLSFPLTRRQYLKEEKDILLHYRNFYAVSKPSYLIAKAKKENKNKKFDRLGLIPYDPISEAFHNLHISRVQANRNIEYRTKFSIVKRESKEFIVKLLDCCENSEEARIFLLHDYKINHYFTDALINDMPYPRLEIAVADKHEEFVGHDYCQQILRQEWLQSDVTGDIIQWHSSKMHEKMFYYVLCVCLYPVHILAYLPAMFMGGYEKKDRHRRIQIKEELQNDEETPLCCGLDFLKKSYLHLSFPINRYIATTISHLIFFVLLFLCSENPWDDDKKIDLDWYDVCISVWSLGFLAIEVKEFTKRYKGKNFSFWNSFSMLLYSILLASQATIGIGFLIGCDKIQKNAVQKLAQSALSALLNTSKSSIFDLSDCEADQPYEHGKYSAVVIGYSIFGILLECH